MTTPEKLLLAAADALREDGVATISARSIATRAGVNQALVFYHFDTVAGLLRAAVEASVDEAVATYREALAGAGSVGDLVALARDLREQEAARGNVAQMAQVLAGAQHDPALAEAARYAVGRWSREVESVLRRVLDSGPLREVVDPAGLAGTVTAAFIGLELVDGVDPSAGAAAFAALEQLAALVSVIEDLGPVATRAVRAGVRRGSSRGRLNDR